MLSMSLSNTTSYQIQSGHDIMWARAHGSIVNICEVPSNSWDAKVWNMGALHVGKQRKELRSRFRDGRKKCFVPLSTGHCSPERDYNNRKNPKTAPVSYLFHTFRFYSVLLTLLPIFPSELTCSFFSLIHSTAFLTHKPSFVLPVRLELSLILWIRHNVLKAGI